MPEWLCPTPGLTPFTVLEDGPVRALWAQDGRAFAVSGRGFYELFAGGTATLRGSVNQNAFPATISGNGVPGHQLLVTSAGINWIYDLTANTFTLLDITNPPTPTRMSLFSDGYFIALKANTNQFNISALYDGTTWDPLDVFQVSTVADQVQAIIETHRDLWLLGTQTSSVWSNTGDEIVYQPVPGVKIDQGCAAAFSAQRIDNAILWLGQSEAGDRVVWRADGYTPRRVSTHAVEYALGQAPRVDDAIAWAYQQEGHLFYVLYVPSLEDVRDWGTTWVYDVATEAWHERALWDSTTLQWQPHLGRCHAFGFGRHLVGARDSGAIYDLRLDMAFDTVVLGGGPARPVAPTLTSLTPDTGAQGTTHAVTLIGTGFVPGGTTVAISGADVVVSDVVVSSTTQLACDVWIAPAASVGGRDVTVTTTAGTSNTRPFLVTAVVVVPEAPTLTSVTPDTGTQGATVGVTLTGTDFVIGATTVAVSGTGVTVSAVVVASATSLTATFTLDGAATVSARSVTVTTATGTSGAVPFTVTAAVVIPEAPTLVTVTPATGTQGATVPVTLTGTGFVVGATTVVASGTGVTVSAVTVSSATTLTASLTLAAGATVGVRSVTVTTAAGTSGPQPFTVTSAAAVPTLTSVTPDTGTQGATVPVTLVGTGFVVGVTTVVVSGTGATVSAVVVSSATTLTATITLAAGAPVGARSVTVSTAAGTSGAVTFTIAAASAPGERDLLVASDLTFVGQQNLDGHNYSNMALALRYVGGQRRFLVYQHGGAAEGVGDLIEYKENVAGLKNGEADWTLGNVPNFTEVRRWRNWSTKDRIIAGSYPAIFGGDGGNGAWPSSFYWDEAHGCLWYTFQPVYPGGGTVWPAYSAVVLLDGEAIVAGDGSTVGRTVSTGNLKGPYYFKDAASASAWKTASSGLLPIPADRQAAMGAAFLNAGHHAANIGSDGPRSLAFWSHGDLPSPPAQDSTILTDAVHLYDTGSASGAVGGCNVRMPNFQYQVGMHASNQVYWDVEGGTGTERHISTGDQALRLTTNSFLYQHEYGDVDTLAVYMNSTAAAGGAWVPEVYTASGWIVPPGWTMAAGTQQLSALENVFYWPTLPQTWVAPIAGADAGIWMRLRQTGTGTNGGSVKALILTTAKPTPQAYPDRPGDALGSFSPVIADAQYDATHYATMYEEMLFGGAWIRTDAVEGIAYCGPLKTGAQWYGGAPAWFQPVGGGVPVKHHFISGENFSNGGKMEGPMYPFFFTFDHTKVLEMAAGTRDRTADGLQPEAYWQMPTEWPGILWYQGVNNTASPYYPEVSFYTYGNGSSVVFDPVTNQLVVWLTHGAVWSGYGIVAFFDVRA